ncbi:MAG: hypothetical protein HQ515_25810 [Phycisphaeraceae bacterium]|nr:hypothetical protein [Phycisphaeraceae bacterium]
MTRGTKGLVILTVLLTLGGAAAAQEGLKDIVEEQGVGWIEGQWKTTTDEGQDIVLSFKWAAKGHTIVHGFEMGERSSQGLIYFDATEEQVKEFGVDSQGKVTKTTWTSEYGKIKAQTQMSDEYGDTTDVVIVYSKVNATTIGVAVHGVEYGVMSDSPWFEIDFNKVKK